MMGGRIEGVSTPGVGSRFCVELPLPRTNDLTRRDLAAPPNPTRLLRVLLAEDHPINQRLIQLILADHVTELMIVDDGAQAVAAFEAQPFDVVLMDMQMPGMDGLTATRALRAVEAARPAAAPTPILMLSAHAMPEHRDSARAAGADLHLAKPITARDLLTALAMLTPA
ncbi:Autoinducer 2 sensor kinase/phosphatase LuxQ [compost metagenome]